MNLFEGCNHTELYQIARAAGLQVPPNTRPADLMAYLTGEKQPPDAVNEMDSWRHGIMGFILEHWKTLETQLTCPARSKDPRSCFTCVDSQVVSCLVDNRPYLLKIQVHKKEEPRRVMSTAINQTSTEPATAPRDAISLGKMGIFKLRVLIQNLGGLKESSEQMAFAKMSPEEKVNEALRLLATWDKEHPQNGTTTAPVEPLRSPAAPIVAAVDPAALAHAQQAAGAAPTAPTTTKRTPRAPASATETPSDLGAAVLTALQGIQAEQVATRTAIEAQTATVKELNATYTQVFHALKALDGRQAQTHRTSELNVALGLLLAEQVLAAPKNDVLSAAAQDVTTIQALLQPVGKA